MSFLSLTMFCNGTQINLVCMETTLQDPLSAPHLWRSALHPATIQMKNVASCRNHKSNLVEDAPFRSGYFSK